MSQRIELRALLAIDQASTSGVAMGALVDGRLKRVSFGVATTCQHRLDMLDEAVALAGGVQWLGVVLEDHTGVPASAGWGSGTLIGMGDARGRWREQLDLASHPEAQRFDVSMRDWRGAVLGRRFATARKEVAKPEAVRWALAKTRASEISHDAAEAMCMLYWAAEEIPRRLAAQRLQGDLLGGF